MSRFERAQVETLLGRLREPPQRIIALFGPRQSGKTMIVDQALDRIRRATGGETLYCAADAAEPPDWDGGAAVLPGRTPVEVPGPDRIVEHWNEARRRAARTGGCVLVFDEIQEVPGWSSVVKGLWDADRGLGRRPHVVILGTAPLIMRDWWPGSRDMRPSRAAAGRAPSCSS